MSTLILSDSRISKHLQKNKNYLSVGQINSQKNSFDLFFISRNLGIICFFFKYFGLLHNCSTVKMSYTFFDYNGSLMYNARARPQGNYAPTTHRKKGFSAGDQ